MKLKYILIIIGSMLFLYGLMSFSTNSFTNTIYYKPSSIIISAIGIGTLLTGVFWKKQ